MCPGPKGTMTASDADSGAWEGERARPGGRGPARTGGQRQSRGKAPASCTGSLCGLGVFCTITGIR